MKTTLDTSYLMTYSWRCLYFLQGKLSNVVVKSDRIEGPALMRTRHFLPHGRQKTLKSPVR